MNTKQQQLIFNKGITNLPSDAICSDNTLDESLGMVYDNGEHRVIQKPEAFITHIYGKKLVDGTDTDNQDLTEKSTILYIHRFNNVNRYIVYADYISTTHTKMRFGERDAVNQSLTLSGCLSGYNGSADVKISSVGKTLIISDTNGIHYHIWKPGGYQHIGDSIPRPIVDFRLAGAGIAGNKFEESVKCDGMLFFDNHIVTAILDGKQEDWNNCVVGLFSLIKRRMHENKRFFGSFCIRAALELYDGTYYHITNPILMVNNFATYGSIEISDFFDNDYVRAYLYGQTLCYKFSNDYTDWADIVKRVTLFVTEESKPFDMTYDAKVDRFTSPSPPYRSYFMTGFMADAVITIQHDDNTIATDPGYALYHAYYAYTPDSGSNYGIDDIIESGVYYKLCSIGIKGDGNWHSASSQIGKHTLENITTQEQLGEDDYFSHCPFKTDSVFVYNGRLNIGNVYRGFFEGFDNFMPFQAASGSEYKFYVTLETDTGTVVVEHTKTTPQYQGLFFYYPDPRAKKVFITKGGSPILNEDLTEHPALHGSYYFAGVSTYMHEPSGASGTAPTKTSPAPFEYLPNTIVTSEVNNPFVFKAEGYNDVGLGEIIGMSTITQALSEGQFGQFPLLVFCSDGIWALSVGDTGTYTKASPMSREVCNNRNSITQTDGAVFFSSDKGLMVIVGNQVKCVSEQLSGKDGHFGGTVDMGMNFLAYLKHPATSIAYDYRDSLLWIINNSNTRSNRAICWIYNIKSGTFAKQDAQANLAHAVNFYPDCLIQDSNGYIYSMLSRPDVSADASTYSATLISRPMKLENSLALKSIMQVRHITAFTTYEVTQTVIDPNTDQQTTETTTQRAQMVFKVYASNNLNTWVQLPSLRGIPWKYYRFVYTFTGLRATDHFAGSVIVTQERRTDKLR